MLIAYPVVSLETCRFHGSGHMYGITSVEPEVPCVCGGGGANFTK